MGRIILFIVLFFALISTSLVSAYSLTQNDISVADRATAVIEGYIQKKWEKYRSVLISQLSVLRSGKYRNQEKWYAIIGRVLDSLEKKNTKKNEESLMDRIETAIKAKLKK